MSENQIFTQMESEDEIISDTMKFRRWLYRVHQLNAEAIRRINEFGCDAGRSKHVIAGVDNGNSGTDLKIGRFFQARNFAAKDVIIFLLIVVLGAVMWAQQSRKDYRRGEHDRSSAAKTESRGSP